jgi:RNA polymerase sigma-70 factor (ECF subfamily)
MTMPVAQDRFLTLLEGHKGILYKVANAYCPNREDRQDLIQEIVVQLWRSFERFDERYKFSTWMYRIAMNVAISFYRRESRRLRRAVSIEASGMEVAASDLADEDTSEDLQKLHRLIGRLDELNRALIILYLDGYSYESIAEIVGITPTNVGTRLNRIKQRLQRDFDATPQATPEENKS